MKKERIVSVPNPDKFGHHDDAKHPGLYPSHPARIIFSGRSGCGKGVAAKNLLARASPPFDRIVVYHYDTESREWLDCEPSDIISELPDDPASFWDRDEKSLLIMDEVPWETLSKADRMKADRCLQYVASHYSLTVYILHQNFVSIPVPIRRAADWWNLWGSVDNVSVRDVSSKTGHDFKSLLLLTSSKFDCITFDFSGIGPPLRLNMFEPIEDTDVDG